MSILAESGVPEEQDPRSQVIAELAPWFHNLHLPDGTQTAPDHFLGDFPNYKWQVISKHIPQDLSGWRVLDIGCNAGFYTFELARRGASVVGIDIDEHYLAQATWAAGEFGLEDRVEFRQMQIYELAGSQEKFDLVLFMGVFYHLRYPLLALDIVSQMAQRLLLFQTLQMDGEEVFPYTTDCYIYDRESLQDRGWPKMAFIEHRYAGDPTNWWIANHAAVEAMLRSSGLKITTRPEPEMYLCEPDPDNPSCIATWNSCELFSVVRSIRRCQQK